MDYPGLPYADGDANPLAAAGIFPVGSRTSLSGSTDWLDRDLEYGERVVLVVDAIVTGVGIAKGPNGPITARKLAAVELYELVGARGKSALETLMVEARRGAPAEMDPLPGLAGALTPDGVVVPESIVDEHGVPVLVELDPIVANLEALDALVGEDDSEAFTVERVGTVIDNLAGHPDDFLTPRRLRLAYAHEAQGFHRGVILDWIDERLGERMAALADLEPWTGYPKASIAATVERLMSNREKHERAGTWDDLLEHVELYEQAHKNRPGIIGYLADARATAPDEAPDTAAGDGLYLPDPEQDDDAPALPGEEGDDQ